MAFADTGGQTYGNGAEPALNLAPAYPSAYDVGGQQVTPPAPDPRDTLLHFLLQHVAAQANQGVHPLEALAHAVVSAHAQAPHPAGFGLPPHFGRLPAAPHFQHLPHVPVAPTY